MSGLTERLGLSLPASLHDAMQQAVVDEAVSDRRQVTLCDLYARAIHQLARRLNSGEDVVFEAHPRGAVKKVSLRCEPAVAHAIDRYSARASRSCFVSTAARRYLADKKSSDTA